MSSLKTVSVTICSENISRTWVCITGKMSCNFKIIGKLRLIFKVLNVILKSLVS